MKIAVVGAETYLARELFTCLAELNISHQHIKGIKANKSNTYEVSYGEDHVIKLLDFEERHFKDLDVVICLGPPLQTKNIIALVKPQGTTVVDATGYSQNAPLTLNGVNLDESVEDRQIIAVPAPLTTMLMGALWHINQLMPLTHALVTSLEPTALKGKAGMDELFYQTRAVFTNDHIQRQVFYKDIAFNAIPQIDDFDTQTGLTYGEDRVEQELRTFLPAMSVTVSRVQAPFFIGQAATVHLGLKNPVDYDALKGHLREQEGISVVDHRVDEGYATPAECAGEDNVFVSRFRSHEALPNGLSFWATADYHRQGFALNVAAIVARLIG